MAVKVYGPHADDEHEKATHVHVSEGHLFLSHWSKEQGSDVTDAIYAPEAWATVAVVSED